MAKVSKEAKSIYSERISEYKKFIDETSQKLKQLKIVLTKDEGGASFKRLLLADESMNLVSYYCIMNRLSIELLGVRNEFFLNEGRKACYEALVSVEQVFSDLVDVPYNEYQEKLIDVRAFPVDQKYNMIKKLGFCIQLVKDSFGENSKWKWAFVEMEGRHAVVAKNCLDLKTMVKELDPRAKQMYKLHMEFLKLTTALLGDAADNHRLKYELSTKKIDDFRVAISYLGALRRLYAYVGQKKAHDEILRKIEGWKAKMNQDLKKAEEMQKQKRLKR